MQKPPQLALRGFHIWLAETGEYARPMQAPCGPVVSCCIRAKNERQPYDSLHPEDALQNASPQVTVAFIPLSLDPGDGPHDRKLRARGEVCDLASLRAQPSSLPVGQTLYVLAKPLCDRSPPSPGLHRQVDQLRNRAAAAFRFASLVLGKTLIALRAPWPR